MPGSEALDRAAITLATWLCWWQWNARNLFPPQRRMKMWRGENGVTNANVEWHLKSLLGNQLKTFWKRFNENYLLIFIGVSLVHSELQKSQNDHRMITESQNEDPPQRGWIWWPSLVVWWKELSIEEWFGNWILKQHGTIARIVKKVKKVGKKNRITAEKTGKCQESCRNVGTNSPSWSWYFGVHNIVLFWAVICEQGVQKIQGVMTWTIEMKRGCENNAGRPFCSQLCYDL